MADLSKAPEATELWRCGATKGPLPTSWVAHAAVGGHEDCRYVGGRVDLANARLCHGGRPASETPQNWEELAASVGPHGRKAAPPKASGRCGGSPRVRGVTTCGERESRPREPRLASGGAARTALSACRRAAGRATHPCSAGHPRQTCPCSAWAWRMPTLRRLRWRHRPPTEA